MEQQRRSEVHVKEFNRVHDQDREHENDRQNAREGGLADELLGGHRYPHLNCGFHCDCRLVSVYKIPWISASQAMAVVDYAAPRAESAIPPAAFVAGWVVLWILAFVSSSSITALALTFVVPFLLLKEYGAAIIGSLGAVVGL